MHDESVCVFAISAISGDLETITIFKFLTVNLYNFIRSLWVEVVDFAALKYMSYFKVFFCLLSKWHLLRFLLTGIYDLKCVFFLFWTAYSFQFFPV